MDWFQIKVWLSAASGLDMDALHVHAGVLCQIVVALLLRKRLSSPWPLLAVAAILIANEIYDYRHEVWPDRSMQQAEAVRDFWNTLLLPTLLLLVARYVPCLFQASAAKPDEPSVSDPG